MGNYRRVKPAGKIVTKTVRRRTQLKLFGAKIRIPGNIASKARFLGDPNALELANYKRFLASAPAGVQECLARPLRIRKFRGRTVLAAERAMDFDGKTSKSISKNGKIESRLFWQKFRQLIDFIVEKNIPFNDISPSNILVKRISETESIPVLEDFKRMRWFSMTPNSWIPSQRNRRLAERAGLIEQKYRAV